MRKMNEDVLDVLKEMRFLEKYQKISDKSRKGFVLEDDIIIKVDRERIESVFEKIRT